MFHSNKNLCSFLFIQEAIFEVETCMSKETLAAGIWWCCHQSWVPCDRVRSCVDNDPGDLETACSMSVCPKMTRAGVVTDPGDLSNDLLLTAQQEAAMASRDHTDAALSEFVSFKFYQNQAQ